jgi:hypothetical protein
LSSVQIMPHPRPFPPAKPSDQGRSSSLWALLYDQPGLHQYSQSLSQIRYKYNNVQTVMCSAKPAGGAPPPPPNPSVFQVFLYFPLNELDGKRSWEGEGEGNGGGEGEMMSERENSPGVVPIWFRRTYLSMLNVLAGKTAMLAGGWRGGGAKWVFNI